VATSFECSIVTPTEQVFAGKVTYATLPAWDGQLGVMAGRSPLLTRLGIGALRLDFVEGGSRWYLIDGGFAQMQNNALTLLTEMAIPAETIKAGEADKEYHDAAAKVTEPGTDRTLVERMQQRALAKRALAGAHSSRGGAI
jgi:F-type H+-transporting ATPase subunit epsilon